MEIKVKDQSFFFSIIHHRQRLQKLPPFHNFAFSLSASGKIRWVCSMNLFITCGRYRCGQVNPSLKNRNSPHRFPCFAAASYFLVSILEYFYKEGWTCNKQAVEALQKQGGVPSERILWPLFANNGGVIC